MRRLMLTAALLVGACASAPPSPLQAPPPMPARIESDPDGGVRITTSATGQPVGQSYAVPAEKMWPIAIDAYARVGLRIDGSDPGRRLVQTRAQALRRKLNGAALSTYFNCGSEMTGLIADNWRLVLDGQMSVGPASTADSSHVATRFTVVARPIEGASAGATACTSTGRLETAVAKAITEALAAQPR